MSQVEKGDKSDHPVSTPASSTDRRRRDYGVVYTVSPLPETSNGFPLSVLVMLQAKPELVPPFCVIFSIMPK